MSARICVHGRQLSICAVCAPEAERRLKVAERIVASAATAPVSPPAPAPGVPPVENAQEASAASTPLETTADAYGSDGELWSRYNELVECPKCGFRFHEDHEDEGAATRQYSCPVCENVDLREQLRASEALAKSPLSPPPTSEPSEEEADLRWAASIVDNYWPTLPQESTRRVEYIRLAERLARMAARRASRVEMTGGNAGASTAGTSPETSADADEVAESIAALTNAAYDAGCRAQGMTTPAIMRAEDRIAVLLREPKASAPQSVDAAASHREPSGHVHDFLVALPGGWMGCGEEGCTATRYDGEPSGPVTRDWPEDFAHENGNYQNRCLTCDSLFRGHKRRLICSQCASDASARRKSSHPRPTEEGV